MAEDLIRLLAAWMLIHEVADEGMKAAVVRGADVKPGSINAGPDAFVDGLSAMIAAEKEALKSELAARAEGADPSEGETGDAALADMRFELGEIRGRLDAIERAVDTLIRRSAG